MLNNALEIWQQRFELAVQSFETKKKNSENNDNLSNVSNQNKLKITDNDWQVFFQSIEEWLEYTRKALLAIGNPLKEIDDLKPKNNNLSEHSKNNNNEV